MALFLTPPVEGNAFAFAAPSSARQNQSACGFPEHLCLKNKIVMCNVFIQESRVFPPYLS